MDGARRAMLVKILHKSVGATIGRPPENISWVPKKTYVCTPIVVGTGVLDGPCNDVDQNNIGVIHAFEKTRHFIIIKFDCIRTVEDAGPYDNGCANIGFLGNP